MHTEFLFVKSMCIVFQFIVFIFAYLGAKQRLVMMQTKSHFSPEFLIKKSKLPFLCIWKSIKVILHTTTRIQKIKNEINTYITAMVDKSCQITTFCSIDNIILINTKQIGWPNALFFVSFLSNIRQHWSYYMTNILDYHFISTNIFSSKKSPVVDGRFSKCQILSSELQKKRKEKK